MERFNGNNLQDMFEYCVNNNVEPAFVEQYASMNLAVIRANSGYPEEWGSCELDEYINTLACGLSEDYDDLAEQYGGEAYARPIRVVRWDGTVIEEW